MWLQRLLLAVALSAGLTGPMAAASAQDRKVDIRALPCKELDTADDGDRIFYVGAKLPDFMIEILVLVVSLICLVLGPLLVFSPQLAEAKRTGNREYGVLAGRYVREFDAKWLRGGAPADEPLVGSADIQSLADIGNSFEVVRTMRIVPFSRETVVQIAAATVVPVLPLLLTMMPLEELLQRLFGVVF